MVTSVAGPFLTSNSPFQKYNARQPVGRCCTNAGKSHAIVKLKMAPIFFLAHWLSCCSAARWCQQWPEATLQQSMLLHQTIIFRFPDFFNWLPAHMKLLCYFSSLHSHNTFWSVPQLSKYNGLDQFTTLFVHWGLSICLINLTVYTQWTYLYNWLKCNTSLV